MCASGSLTWHGGNRGQKGEIEVSKSNCPLLFSYAKLTLLTIEAVLVLFYLLNILLFVPFKTMIRVKGSASE